MTHETPKLGLLLAIAALAVHGGGCELIGGSEEGRQASALLERIAAVTEARALPDRQRAIDRLRAQAATADDLKQTRNACADAYQAALDAESRSAEAGLALQKLKSRYAGVETGVPVEEAAPVLTSIDDSNAKLAAAQRDIPRCERLTRELMVRSR